MVSEGLSLSMILSILIATFTMWMMVSCYATISRSMLKYFDIEQRAQLLRWQIGTIRPRRYNKDLRKFVK